MKQKVKEKVKVCSIDYFQISLEIWPQKKSRESPISMFSYQEKSLSLSSKLKYSVIEGGVATVKITKKDFILLSVMVSIICVSSHVT